MSNKKDPYGLTDNERMLIHSVAKNIRQAQTLDTSPMFALIETLIQKRTIRLETLLEILSDPERARPEGWETYPEGVEVVP